MNYLITAVCIIVPVAIIFLLTRKNKKVEHQSHEIYSAKERENYQKYKAKFYRPKRYRKGPKI